MILLKIKSFQTLQKWRNLFANKDARYKYIFYWAAAVDGIGLFVDEQAKIVYENGFLVDWKINCLFLLGCEKCWKG
jgi:hypothetical protein